MATTQLLKAGFFALAIGLFGCERSVSFAGDVQPIIEASCIECHDNSAEGSTASGFSMVDYESVMKGTRFGPVVIPNSSISSTLYLVIAGKTGPEIQMPPQHEEAWAEGRGAPLSEKQIKIIADWIDQGANDN